MNAFIENMAISFITIATGLAILTYSLVWYARKVKSESSPEKDDNKEVV